ncbi:MAG: lipopolysaccharide transport periplasmic protein LptA [Burkholderiales bacterium]|nr:lipopolysaccharide transport periplasmic protein LptA [Burkholderiales bacterium]
MKNKWILVALLLQAGPVLAEKADKEKPIQVDADRIQIDDAKKVNTFEGNVVLTQGTLVIRADRIVVTQDEAGNKHAVAYSSGSPVHFRQKREGFDEYVEGEGNRAEYDGKTDTVEFFGNAYVKRAQDIVTGNYISYNSNTEFFQSVGGARTPTGRVHAVIQPKKKDAGGAAPLLIEPSKTMASPPRQ